MNDALSSRRQFLIRAGWMGAAALVPMSAAPRRKLFIDQDTLGPGTTNLQSLGMLLAAPRVDILGIGVVTGDHWRDFEVRHALRLLELARRPEIPVFPGAVFPLINSAERTAAWEKMYGRLVYKGAWDLERPGKFADPYGAPPLEEGEPALRPQSTAAAEAMVQLVRRYPGEISIWAGGPLTNVALACRLDPQFAAQAKELLFMGGSFQPQTDAREFKHSPRRSFNLRFDPEAAHIALTAPWRKLVCSPVDASASLRSGASDFAEIKRTPGALAQYFARYGEANRPMRDEVAAATWIDSTLVTKSERYFVDVSVDQGSSYGDALSWAPGYEPGRGERQAFVQTGIDEARFRRMFVELLSR